MSNNLSVYLKTAKLKKVASAVFNLYGPQMSSDLSLAGTKPFVKCA